MIQILLTLCALFLVINGQQQFYCNSNEEAIFKQCLRDSMPNGVDVRRLEEALRQCFRSNDCNEPNYQQQPFAGLTSQTQPNNLQFRLPRQNRQFLNNPSQIFNQPNFGSGLNDGRYQQGNSLYNNRGYQGNSEIGNTINNPGYQYQYNSNNRQGINGYYTDNGDNGQYQYQLTDNAVNENFNRIQQPFTSRFFDDRDVWIANSCPSVYTDKIKVKRCIDQVFPLRNHTFYCSTPERRYQAIQQCANRQSENCRYKFQRWTDYCTRNYYNSATVVKNAPYLGFILLIQVTITVLLIK